MTTADLQAFVGKTYPPFTVEIEKGRLRLFAKAIGSANPVHIDEAAAAAAGFPALPAPPTFAFSLAMDAGQSFNVLEDMKIPLHKAVHGAQGSRYIKPILAGDAITGQQTVTKVYDKKGGALLFIEAEIRMTNQHGEHVADLSSTVIVRN